MVSYAIFYFYSALARLRIADQRNETGGADAFQLVEGSLRLMRFWSEITPATFQHNADLIAAEKARVAGDLEGLHGRGAEAQGRDARPVRGARTPAPRAGVGERALAVACFEWMVLHRPFLGGLAAIERC